MSGGSSQRAWPRLITAAGVCHLDIVRLIENCIRLHTSKAVTSAAALWWCLPGLSSGVVADSEALSDRGYAEVESQRLPVNSYAGGMHLRQALQQPR